jgi:hypothetical protein
VLTTARYVQFHPLVYIIKLYIEMNMADLITKVVRASNPAGHGSSSGPATHTQTQSGKNQAAASRTKTTKDGTTVPSGIFGNSADKNYTAKISAQGADNVDIELGDFVHSPQSGGIQKTVQVTTDVSHTGNGKMSEEVDEGAETETEANSESSSTRRLKRHYGV